MWFIIIHMTISILFRPKNRVQGKIFRIFRESFSNFSPSRKFFRRPKFFSKFSWHRCDSFGPKIVKIGAILTVFRPFEISRKFVPYKLLQNFLCGYKIEMAICFSINFVSTPCGKNDNYFLLGNLDHFRVNFTIFSDCFRSVFGSFSNCFARSLRCFFRFFGVVNVVIIVFAVIAVIFVRGIPPPRRHRKNASSFSFSAGGKTWRSLGEPDSTSENA